MADLPDWLENAVGSFAIGREEADIINEYLIEDQGMPEPSEWDSAKFEINPDSLEITVWDNEGNEYAFALDVDDWLNDDWTWFFDIQDFFADFVEVEWERYDRTT